MTTPAPPVSMWMTAAEVARVLAVSKMTVYRLLDDNELEHVRVGRNFRVRRTSVARFIAKGGTSDRPYRTPANVART